IIPCPRPKVWAETRTPITPVTTPFFLTRISRLGQPVPGAGHRDRLSPPSVRALQRGPAISITWKSRLFGRDSAIRAMAVNVFRETSNEKQVTSYAGAGFSDPQRRSTQTSAGIAQASR